MQNTGVRREPSNFFNQSHLTRLIHVMKPARRAKSNLTFPNTGLSS